MSPEPDTKDQAVRCLWEGVRIKDAADEPRDLARAAEIFTSIESAHPTHRDIVAKALLQLADCAERLGDDTAAEALRRRVAEDFANDDPEAAGIAMLSIGAGLVLAGDQEPARGWLQKALGLLADPQQRTEAALWTAQSVLLDGSPEAAREQLSALLEALPEHQMQHARMRALDLIGLSYLSQRDHAAAADVVEQMRSALSGELVDEMLSRSMTGYLLDHAGGAGASPESSHRR